jgi:hypothetical protein
MRRLALIGLCTVSLTGCAFNSWDRPPFFAGSDPYAPNGDTENMRRARGQPIAVQKLTPMAGNMWPGPVPETPSMADLVKQERGGQLPQLQPLPGQPPSATMPPPQGSLAPPPPLHPVQPVVPPVPNYAKPGGPGVAAGPQTGEVVQTPQGPAVTSGGSGTFKTITLPNGQTGIVVPNGNGTSTIIMSNGQVQTIPSK